MSTDPHNPSPPERWNFPWRGVVIGMFLTLGLLAWAFRQDFIRHSDVWMEIVLWPALGMLLLGYWQGYKASGRENPAWPWLLGSAALVAVAACLVQPFHSTDVFGYINRGWEQVYHHMNPYVHPVSDIPGWRDDPMITRHWVENPSPYGFVYMQLVKPLTLLGRGDKALTLLVFKGFNLLLHFGIIGLLVAACRRLPWADPRRAVYLYAFNPLVLVHLLSNGHNDILMGFLLLSSAAAALSGVLWAIIPLLVTAALVKYATLVVLPLAVLFLLKHRAWKALLGGLALSAAIFAVSSAAYLPDWQNFQFGEIRHNAFITRGSLHSLFYQGYKTLDSTLFPVLHPYREIVHGLLKSGLLLGFAVFYAELCRRVLRKPAYPAAAWLEHALLVMVVLIAAVSLKFYPWYLGMFFPLALLIPPERFLFRFVLLFSCFQLLAVTFLGQARFADFLLLTALPFLIAWKRHTRAASSTEVPAAAASFQKAEAGGT